MFKIVTALGLILSLSSAGAVMAQGGPAPATNHVTGAPVEARPTLAFRAEFDGPPTEDPVTMASIKNKELRFATYGPGKGMVDKVFHPTPPDEGGFITSINCTQLCGFTLYLPNSYIDLRGQSKITWRTKQTGLHQIRLMIKTADGTLFVSDQSVGAASDWRVSDLIIPDLKWRAVDVAHMNDESLARGAPQWATPDLSKVAEVGWTDLAAGSGHEAMGGSSRVSWIGVYGKRVPRT